MKVSELAIPGVLLIEPRVFRDQRGQFFESYSERRYAEAGLAARFVQDNASSSSRGTVRGLHFQVRRPQAKLVWVLEGAVFDVAVDVRRGSPTYGQWVSATLDATNHHQLYVPAGFAHGFAVLSERAVLAYKCTDYYDPEGESGVSWSDPALGITWPISSADAVLSAKDAALPRLADAPDPHLT